MANIAVHPLAIEATFGSLLVLTGMYTALPLWLSLLVVVAWWVYIRTMTAWSFRAPSKRKEPIEDREWVSVPVKTTLGTMQTYHSPTIQGAPYVLACHGWSSGSIRMTDRVQPYLDRGFNAVLIDLPSHGASSTLPYWSAERSVSLVIESLNSIIDESGSKHSTPLFYVGHSMGGFVGFRLSKRRSELNPQWKLSGWVMESPMTGYTEIFDETCRLLKVPNLFKKSLEYRVLKRFQTLNPSTTDIEGLNDADLPVWGMVQEPCLLVQADPDDRLGDSHHERLVNTMGHQGKGLLSTHMLPTLTHSGSHVHPQRNQLVGEWLDAMLKDSP